MYRSLSLLLLFTLALAAPARAATGLTVESTPVAGAVFVNGVPAGATPLNLSGIEPGFATVVVSAPGRGLFSKRVKIKDGKVAKVKAKLKKARPLAEERKAGAYAAVEQNTALSGEWRGLLRLLSGLYDDLDLGIFSHGPAARSFSAEGYYIEVSIVVGGPSDLEIVADLYLDEALTQPAGQMSLLLDSLGLVADYSFTAGTYGGSTGHLEGTALGPWGVVATGAGAFSDGTSWTASLFIDLFDDALEFSGEVDVTHPDATTAHWSVDGSITGSDVLITTSEGYTLDLFLNADGSGGGIIVDPDSKPLAVITWDADGAGIIVYADGTTGSFHLYL